MGLERLEKIQRDGGRLGCVFPQAICFGAEGVKVLYQ
jgi:hypothetical protein